MNRVARRKSKKRLGTPRVSACVGAVISQHGPQALLNAACALSLSPNKLWCVGATASRRAAELSPATPQEEARVTLSLPQRPTFAPVLDLLCDDPARRRASPGRWHYCWRSRYTSTRELDLARHGRYAVHSHRNQLIISLGWWHKEAVNRTLRHLGWRHSPPQLPRGGRRSTLHFGDNRKRLAPRRN